MESPAVQASLEARARMASGLEDSLQELRRFDLSKRLAELAIFPALWLGGLAMILLAYSPGRPIEHPMLLVAGILVSAVALNAHVLLMHEGMHQTLFQSRTWNRWVSVLIGSTFLMSFTAYQVMHVRHHTYLGDERDPDDYHNYTDKAPLVWLLHFVRLTLGPLLYIFLIPVFALRYGTSVERRRIAVEYALLVAVYSVIGSMVNPKLLVVAWLIPLVLVGQMTAIRGFTQHGITNAADPFIASRSIKANRLVAFCLLNENFHLEHHLFPEIPSYHLERLHTLLRPRLPYLVTGRSYLAFIARFLRATVRMDETPIGLEVLSRKDPA